jgi:hypothetical protein
MLVLIFKYWHNYLFLVQTSYESYIRLLLIYNKYIGNNANVN